jgi:uncharacterized protein (UPF0332 family)/predicted nucleotidyltransferase
MKAGTFVSIDGTRIKARSNLHRKKLLALKHFVQQLEQSPARANISKIILFGSAANGSVHSESDIDVLIYGRHPLERAEQASFDAALQTQLAWSESIEPFVYPVSAYFEPSSDFEYQVLRQGREVFTVDEPTLAHQAAETFYDLAIEYLAEVRRKYDAQIEGSRRVAIDGGYNAAELCAKGMLRLVTRARPKTHSGINTVFSDKYVKTKRVPVTLGRDFRVALTYRNKARYDGDAVISDEMVEHVFRFAEQMINLLEQALAK